jgi:pimeloyl-ACP methyl ester carboxylesterase
MVHGFGTSGFLFRTVAVAVAGHGHTALAVDLLGYGESERPAGARFGIGAQSGYLERVLVEQRVARAVVVGNDLGGAIALRLAFDHPERVAGLVLINSPAPGAPPARDVRELRRTTRRQAFRAARGVLGAAAPLVPLLVGSVADAAHMPPALQARYLAPFAGRDGATQLLSLARSIRPGELDAVALEQIAVPTVVIRGDADAWLDAGAAERLAAKIPGARLVRLAGVGRLVTEEAPDAVVAAILEVVGAVRETDSPFSEETPIGESAL